MVNCPQHDGPAIEMVKKHANSVGSNRGLRIGSYLELGLNDDGHHASRTRERLRPSRNRCPDFGSLISGLPVQVDVFALQQLFERANGSLTITLVLASA
jgi:hypothetical protein